MDFIKKAVNDATKGQNAGSSTTTTTTDNNAAGGAPAAPPAEGQQPQQSQDYGDKAFAFGSKKAGYNVDANTQEKITDGARGAYEKFTGNKVDAKYSN